MCVCVCVTFLPYSYHPRGTAERILAPCHLPPAPQPLRHVFARQNLPADAPNAADVAPGSDRIAGSLEENRTKKMETMGKMKDKHGGSEGK